MKFDLGIGLGCAHIGHLIIIMQVVAINYFNSTISIGLGVGVNSLEIYYCDWDRRQQINFK